ncbi:MAG: HAD hydrolase family protein [Holophagales bacterium]|nr:HAD hydrolase family protein [Holophagales bacterium]
MPQHFRAIALDYDGTLTSTGRLDDTILGALQTLRKERLKLVLVTGRIPWELLELCPHAEELFDRIVWENGAVVWGLRGARVLAPPVPAELEEALVQRGVVLRRGQAILAGHARDAGAALEEIGRLGLEVQVVRNRQELMLVPAGVSKGTGLFDALGDLGISRHSTLAVGDAENDHSLLGACELGVAVANAVPSLKEAADVVLSEGGSAGLARFLLGPAVLSDETPEPRRFQAVLGTWEDGSAAKVPASGVNVLVTGGTMSGKSHLTGLLAERLLGLGYSLCVLDPEGDHVSLGRLRGVLPVGGNEPLPGPEQLPRLIEHRFGSVVVDLSFLEPSAKLAYCRAALEELAALWSDTGLPHWLFVDEAQVALNLAHDRVEGFDPRRPGTCLTTWQPEHLPEEILESLDVVLDLGAEEASNLPAWAGPAGIRPAPGQALLSRRGGTGPRPFTVARRASPHARHLHKYSAKALPVSQHFFFRSGTGETGRSAANVEEFHREIRRADGRVVRHHALHGDLSRWIADVLRDEVLAETVRKAERALRHRASTYEIESLRTEVLAAIQDRYQG